ncbi:hypothetical protein P170DRAFT_359775 [Aspergillus steynii IBT 23096]|uniref:ABC transporter domain-containing protein n=1 Tax=Aspergillus steynii IBT 23096 TaxID=1392250 RepID=A0A2I2G6L4_9EURO|nr:uncharacterized protein P170DRAFT_359775 [Aspergillus steynii IBT 23096]PLB48516.1 hypothetical protein P170DRAFT_359775 [Aspergillus steynii IBT 23096]
MKTLSKRTSRPDSHKNPFDPSEPGWKLERALKAAVARSNAEGSHPNLLKSSVRWRNVNVYGEGATARAQPTVSSFLTDCFRNVRGIFGRSSERQILYDFDGLLNEGEMLLVLGLPGSGCSTLLRTLSGHDEGFSKWSGDITYSGVPVEVMKKDFRGKVVFNEENESHFPHLTVGQTLEFAIKTKTPRNRIGGVSRQKYIETMRNILGATFGLTHTFQTRVGNDYIRGVSGGERRRVSLAEMVIQLATCPSVTYWDNPTRGLDSSTSLEFAGALRAATNLTNTVAVSALYQPGDSLVDVFDKVTILHDGHQIFFGELSAAKEHFQELGFVFHPRQTTAEFLLSVTDPGSRKVREGFEHTVPRTVGDLVSSWKASKHYKQLMSETAHHGDMYPRGYSESIGSFKKIQNAEKAPFNRSKSPYTINWGMQFLSTYLRSCQRIISDKAYTLAVVVTMGVVALLIGSMFYDIPDDTSGYFSKGGCVFFSVLFNILVSFVEISAQFSQRQVVAKHKSYAMYHPSIDALASMVAQYPIKFMNSAVFSVVVYFMVGFKQEAGAFFVFLLFIFLTSVTLSAFFRTIAALVNRVEIALAVAGIILLVLSIYAGYVIPRPSMHPWFKWLSYINPIYYAVESLMVMEFHGRKSVCGTLVPSGPGYENASILNQVCASVGSVAGEMYVSGDTYVEASFSYSYSHLWRNLGISIAFFVFFVFTYAAATELKSPPALKGGQLLFQDKRDVSTQSGLGDTEKQAQHQCREDSHAPLEENTLMQNLTRSENVFTWQGVTYDIEVKGENRRLLSDVQGYVKPGEMTALMGESGAGKTTLLNILAQRVSTGVISGDMLVNGRRLGHAFQRGTGYVQQQDVHFEEATVREAFRFSALLRQPRDVPLEEKYAYVEKVIDALGMHEYAGAVIGTPGRGLSVEQRKRTTIGLELVAKPSILLFLDEPTSGLDSRSAMSIVKLLRSLANAGQAILCTIHQPSSLLFEEFDRLLLLVKGGKTAYFGDVGENSSTVLSYFERNGGYACPGNANPAEYILDVVGAGATAQSSQNWAATWKNSPEALRNTNEIQSLVKMKRGNTTESNDDESDTSQAIYALPWIHQYIAVQQRLFVQYWRSPVYVVSKIAINTVGGLFLGFTFFKQDSSVAGLQNSIFSVFMLLLLSLVILVQLQPRLIEYRNLYEVREKHSKMYSWTVFITASIVTEIPYNIVIASVCFICWYFPVGWWRTISAGRGAFMWLIFMVYQLYHTSFSQAVAIAAPDAETASMVTILFYTFIFAFTGVVQPLPQLVGFWHFAYYVSPFTYTVASMMSSMTHEILVKCAEGELNFFNPPSGMTCGEYAGAFVNASMATLSNPSATENCEFCQYSVSDVFLEGFNIRYSERWHHFGYLWAFIAFNVCLFFGIYYLVFQGGAAKIGRMFSGIVSKREKAKSADKHRG